VVPCSHNLSGDLQTAPVDAFQGGVNSSPSITA
jgi:hypothetical protein